MWRRSVLQIPSRLSQQQARAVLRIARVNFHTTQPRCVIKPFLLADIGEGIRECEIIQWFVEPGAKVEQFDNICEVQSDKASVEISSRYDGVIKKLYYEAGDMAIVGKPLVDIDMAEEAEDASQAGEGKEESSKATPAEPVKTSTQQLQTISSESTIPPATTNTKPGKHASLATPAVRRLIREHGLNIEDVQGSGKDGRVLKDDVVRHAGSASSSSASSSPDSKLPVPDVPTPAYSVPQPTKEETIVPLTPIQNQMFKAMTKSLTIPHFLFTDEITLDTLAKSRESINKSLPAMKTPSINRISYLPFFIKAVSLALNDYPIVNSRIDMSEETKPKLVVRPQHNIGVAMDTPNGLLVPNIKNVQSLSILEIALELKRLQAAGAEGKMSAADMKGGTITVSNIGNIGGTYLAPVIVTSEVAIVGIGQAKTIPAFDDKMAVVPKTVVNFSWSADHRVLDGATMARMAALVKQYVEQPDLMSLRLR